MLESSAPSCAHAGRIGDVHAAASVLVIYNITSIGRQSVRFLIHSAQNQPNAQAINRTFAYYYTSTNLTVPSQQWKTACCKVSLQPTTRVLHRPPEDTLTQDRAATTHLCVITPALAHMRRFQHLWFRGENGVHNAGAWYTRGNWGQTCMDQNLKVTNTTKNGGKLPAHHSPACGAKWLPVDNGVLQ